jgi:hypothetical protein
MKEREVKELWVVGTAVVSSIGFIVLGIMLGRSPLEWDIHVISASAILTVILATPDSDGTSCTEGKERRRVLQ